MQPLPFSRWLVLAFISWCASFSPTALAMELASQYYSALEIPNNLRPNLDGKLDDSVWLMAASIRNFVTQLPNAEGAPVVATEMMLANDETYLYIALRAYDPQAADINSSWNKRDQIDDEQDSFTIYIDLNAEPTGNEILNKEKGEVAQFFKINASGVLADGIFHRGKQFHDFSQDFEFEGVAKIFDDGWAAELKIPLKQFRLESASKFKVWSMVALRNYVREQAYTLRSPQLVRNYYCILCLAAEHNTYQINRVFWPQEKPRSLQTVLKAQTIENTVKSLEIQAQPLEHVVLEGSFKPDNINDESLLSPIKENRPFAAKYDEDRAFFLANADLFPEQGEGAGNAVVYTRSISNQAWGMRASTRSRYADGVWLSSFDHGGGKVLLPHAYHTEFVDQPSSLASIAHARFNLAQMQIGALFSERDYAERGFNRVLGPNLLYQLNPEMSLAAHWLRSQTTAQLDQDGELALAESSEGEARHIEYRYQGQRWHAQLFSESVSPEFRADNGFFGQVGYRTRFAQVKRKFGNDEHAFDFLLRYQDKRDWQGNIIKRGLRPAFFYSGARDTSINLEFAMHEQQRLLDGGKLHSISNLLIEFSSVPSNWLPQANLRLNLGDKVDWKSDEKFKGGSLEMKLALRPVRKLDLKLYWLKEWFRASQVISSSGDAEKNYALQMQAIWQLDVNTSVRLLFSHGKTTRNPMLYERGMELSPFDSNLSNSLSLQKRLSPRLDFSLGIQHPLNEGGRRDAYFKFLFKL